MSSRSSCRGETGGLGLFTKLWQGNYTAHLYILSTSILHQEVHVKVTHTCHWRKLVLYHNDTLFFVQVMFYSHTRLYMHVCNTQSLFPLISIAVNVPEYQKVEQSDSVLPSPLTVQSPVEAFFTNSPLKSLVASPQLRSKQNQVNRVHINIK